MPELPLKAVERILREAGARRVSKEASREFGRCLEDLIRQIAKEAAALAEHSGRRTITDSDIILAAKRRKRLMFHREQEH